MAMLVKATQDGYYGDKYRYAGDEFEIDDDKAFSKRWMEQIKKLSPAFKDKGGE